MDYLSFAESFAREAGNIIKRDFLHVQRKFKSDGSVVTATDIAINELLITRVKKEFPNHDVLGEEASSLDQKNGQVWVCDPLDGTLPFVMGIPTACFSLALVVKGQPVLGVVYDPFADRLFSAQAGRGSFCDGKRLSVSAVDSLNGTVVGLTSSSSATYDSVPLYQGVVGQGGRVFNIGSTVMMGMLVASGEFAGLIFPHASAHDVAAVTVIVEEAGGLCVDFQGNVQEYDGLVNGFICAPKGVIKELVALAALCKRNV